MMMVELRASHKNSVAEWLFICVLINLTKITALSNPFLTSVSGTFRNSLRWFGTQPGTMMRELALKQERT